MKKNKVDKEKAVNGIVITLIVAVVGVGVYNFCCNKSFLSASVTQVLTLAISISIVYIATQYKNDVRKMKENAEIILRKLQDTVTRESFYAIDAQGDKEETQKHINITKRKINNYIDILEKYSETLKFNDEITYVRSQFDTYKTRIGDHFSDLEYLSKSEDEFRRIAENIDTKCDYIILNLYK